MCQGGEKMVRDNWMEMGLISTYSRDDFVSKKEKREQVGILNLKNIGV